MTGDPGPVPDDDGGGATRAHREMALALGLVAAGAVVALLGSGRSTGGTPGVPAAPGSETGSGAPAALALVALAGAGAALLVRSRARVAVGVVLVAVAVGLVLVGTGPVRWTALAGGVVVGVGALLVVLRAGRWPQPRRRYDRGDRVAGRREDSPREAWDALDRGDDPTT